MHVYLRALHFVRFHFFTYARLSCDRPTKFNWLRGGILSRLSLLYGWTIADFSPMIYTIIPAGRD